MRKEGCAPGFWRDEPDERQCPSRPTPSDVSPVMLRLITYGKAVRSYHQSILTFSSLKHALTTPGTTNEVPRFKCPFVLVLLGMSLFVR